MKSHKTIILLVTLTWMYAGGSEDRDELETVRTKNLRQVTHVQQEHVDVEPILIEESLVIEGRASAAEPAPANFRGRVFIDGNANKRMNVDEAGVPNVQVRLYRTGENEGKRYYIKKTTTLQDGSFEISLKNVRDDAEYYLGFRLNNKSAYAFFSGGDSNADSNAVNQGGQKTYTTPQKITNGGRYEINVGVDQVGAVVYGKTWYDYNGEVEEKATGKVYLWQTHEGLPRTKVASQKIRKDGTYELPLKQVRDDREYNLEFRLTTNPLQLEDGKRDEWNVAVIKPDKREVIEPDPAVFTLALWEDYNANGLQDPQIGEYSFEYGYTVSLWSNSGGTDELVEQVHVDAGGGAHLAVTRIPKDTKYYIQFKPDEDGFVFSPRVADGDNDVDENGRSDNMSIDYGKTYVVHAGAYRDGQRPPAVFAGRVFTDDNANGSVDPDKGEYCCWLGGYTLSVWRTTDGSDEMVKQVHVDELYNSKIAVYNIDKDSLYYLQLEPDDDDLVFSPRGDSEHGLEISQVDSTGRSDPISIDHENLYFVYTGVHKEKKRPTRDAVFFRASSGGFVGDPAVSGTELYITDGSQDGTRLVKDIWKGVDSSKPQGFVAMDNKVYFAASVGGYFNDPETVGTELFVSDGTEKGTKLVKDIWKGSKSSNPHELTVMNGKLYFVASVGGYFKDPETVGTELFVSDGTEKGTKLVKDIWKGSKSSNPHELTVMNGKLYFVASVGGYFNDPETIGTELFMSDGTEKGTKLVKDIWKGSKSSNPRELTAIDGRLYFAADVGGYFANPNTIGTEPWVSDGTPEGTYPLKNIHDRYHSSDVELHTYQFMKATVPA